MLTPPMPSRDEMAANTARSAAARFRITAATAHPDEVDTAAVGAIGAYTAHDDTTVAAVARAILLARDAIETARPCGRTPVARDRRQQPTT